MKAKWSKVSPKTNGWYWIKYQGKNGIVKCPAFLYTITLSTARNDLFCCRDGFWCYGSEKDKTLRFGPKIVEPE